MLQATKTKEAGILGILINIVDLCSMYTPGIGISKRLQNFCYAKYNYTRFRLHVFVFVVYALVDCKCNGIHLLWYLLNAENVRGHGATVAFKGSWFSAACDPCV